MRKPGWWPGLSISMYLVYQGCQAARIKIPQYKDALFGLFRSTEGDYSVDLFRPPVTRPPTKRRDCDHHKDVYQCTRFMKSAARFVDEHPSEQRQRTKHDCWMWCWNRLEHLILLTIARLYAISDNSRKATTARTWWTGRLRFPFIAIRLR